MWLREYNCMDDGISIITNCNSVGLYVKFGTKKFIDLWLYIYNLFKVRVILSSQKGVVCITAVLFPVLFSPKC